MTPVLTFTCTICAEPSRDICVYCTKDTCPNHLCERCARCSDCCECNIRLDEASHLAPPVLDAAVPAPPVEAAPVEAAPVESAPSEPPSLEAPIAPEPEAAEAPEGPPREPLV